MKYIAIIFGALLVVSTHGFAFTVWVPVECRGPDHHHDESKNRHGASRCVSKCDCDGKRTCSAFGYCEGVARNELSEEPTLENSSADSNAD